MSQKSTSLLSRIFNGADMERRIAELEAELKVRTEIMNITSIVSEADKKGDILSINEKFIEVSKYSRDELIGHPHNTTRHPDMPKETFKQLWSTIGRGDIFRGVIKNRAKDGTPYYVDAVVAPILGDNGKPMKYLGVRYDITVAEIERQNAKGILDAIDDSYAYIEFDLNGNILKANKNFLQVMGYQSNDVVGRHHRMFCDPVITASAAYQNFWRDLGEGKAQNGVFKRITKSGQEVHLRRHRRCQFQHHVAPGS
jgi:methyl-accepting chemotaxis protein